LVQRVLLLRWGARLGGTGICFLLGQRRFNLSEPLRHTGELLVWCWVALTANRRELCANIRQIPLESRGIVARWRYRAALPASLWGGLASGEQRSCAHPKGRH
jgi:hypothetical protein